jgi:hypothetical protein
VVALIDTWNTNNFVNFKLIVSSMALKFSSFPDFQVAIANDPMMKCTGVVKGLQVQLENYEPSSIFLCYLL